MSHLHYYLYMGHHIFDYATRYVSNHDTIAPAADFSLTDADYEAFKDFVEQRDFKYDKMSSKRLEELREAMTFEGYMDENAKHLIEQLEQSLQHNVRQDLDTFRKEIELSLAQEIVRRYYYQRGAIEVSLRGDTTIKGAVELLQSPMQYKEILSPKKVVK